MESGVLKTYAHKGPKPLRLHRTPLRLLHLATPHVPRAVAQKEPDAPSENGVTALLGGSTDATSLHKSKCLVCSQYRDVEVFLRGQLLELWSLDDIAPKQLSIKIELGTVYLMASSNRGVNEDSFERLVSRLNSDQYQTHFSPDVPVSVLRAVGDLCGRETETKFVVVKIVLFSSDKQSRLTARAMWRNDNSAFEVLYMEGIGITFSWTVLPLRLQHLFSDKCKKNIAFPFDVQLRAFHRSKHVSDHEALPLVNAALRELTEMENISPASRRFDSLDFSTVFELNAASPDYVVESITVEHTEQRRWHDLLVDETETVLLEGFTAPQGGRSSLGAFLLSQQERGGDPDAAPQTVLSANRARYTVARFRNATIHWKIKHGVPHEENVQPLTSALELASAVVAKANELLVDGSATDAPEPL
jgi:hypothetical protein